MKNIKYIVLLVALVWISACRKDHFVDVKEVPTADISVVTNVNGLILDENKNPLANAEIRILDKTVLTDEHGVFLFKRVTINNEGSKIKIAKENYFDVYRIIYPHKPKEIIYIEINMAKKGAPRFFQSTEGGTVTFGAASVTFAKNALRYDIGETGALNYNGKVSVYTHYYDPTDPNLSQVAPADLVGLDKEGKDIVMYTYGMVAVELYAADGKKLQLTKDAELSFTIAEDMVNDAPSTISLLSIDEDLGMWKEEGIATKMGNKYNGKVSHFSFWNVDVLSSFVKIQGYLKYSNGTPIINQSIFISRNDAPGAIGYTNNIGFFKGKVPSNELLEMHIESCKLKDVNKDIGPFDTDFDFGDLILELNDLSTNVNGSVKGCNMEPLPYAYGIVTPYHKLVSLDENGNFSFVVQNCHMEDYKIKFYDGVNLMSSEVYDIDETIDVNTYAEVLLCEEVDDFFRYSINGGSYNLHPDFKVGISDEKDIIIKSNGNYIVMTANGTGDFEIQKMFVSHTQYGLCNLGESNSEERCNQMSITISKLDMSNGIIEGSFEGFLYKDTMDVVADIAVLGDFKSSNLEVFESGSISGSVWVDSNENGVRDVGEVDMNGLNLGYVRLKYNGLSNPIFGDNYSAIAPDGTYEFKGLQPHDYKIIYYGGGTYYDLTSFQSGASDIDNDFKLVGNDFLSGNLQLQAGANIEHVDLGIKINTSELSVYLTGHGCIPNLEVEYSITGGIAPFVIMLSDGQSQTTESRSGIFEVLQGGTYTVSVKDTWGAMGEQTYELFEYQDTKIWGRVWVDTDGGIPNFIDDMDGSYDGVTIGLVSENGDILQTTVSNTYYVFREFPYGNYYIEIKLPSGYSLVDKSPFSEAIGSHINVSTYKSDIFSIDDCGNPTIINIGLKEN